MARRLAQADAVARDLALHTIRERLARLIVGRLSAGASKFVEFAESRQDLAELLGAAAEVVSRTFSEFARIGGASRAEAATAKRGRRDDPWSGPRSAGRDLICF